jgi:hypothetical protein
VPGGDFVVDKRSKTRSGNNSRTDCGEYGDKDRRYLKELFRFSCVLRGEVKHLERIKEYIIGEYVDKGLVNLIKPTYDKKELYIVTCDEWEEYQKLKKKDDRLIGVGWM